jgi:dethiobiotin synthetase
MTFGVFVTGTDTGVGKTRVAAALLRAWVGNGYRAVGMKPVAAGIPFGQQENPDVAVLKAAGNVDAPHSDRNPYAFAPAVAPHLAAAQAGVRIELPVIVAAYARLAAKAQRIAVEGAGGALVPLNHELDMLDIAACLDLPVLLVVGMRLGCINHALLTEAAVRKRGLRIKGWIANVVEPEMEALDGNLDALAQRMPAPRLALVGWEQCLDFDANTLATLTD